MKIGFKNIMVLLALILGGSSCDSFLDVQPKGEVLEGDLLKDAKGFENALYGGLCQDGVNELVRAESELFRFGSDGSILYLYK